jgi:hypothetical protein
MESESAAISQAFDKAAAGLKKQDLSNVQNLAGLLATLGIATDDGTLILSGFSLGSASGLYSSLSNLVTINPSLGSLLDEVSKEMLTVLQELKPQLSGKKHEPEVILSALGKLARSTFSLQQRLTELQQLLPLGGGTSLE